MNSVTERSTELGGAAMNQGRMEVVAADGKKVTEYTKLPHKVDDGPRKM